LTKKTTNIAGRKYPGHGRRARFAPCDDQKPKEKLKDMKKQLSLIGLAAFALLAFSPSQARATLYDFSYVDTATLGTIVQASGTLTTSGLLTALTGVPGVSGYDITAVTGERNGFAITGIDLNLAFPNSSVNNGNMYDDALIVSPNGTFDVDGLNFYSADGNTYNLSSLYTPTGGGTWDTVTTSQVIGTEVNLTITAVPEPTTIISGVLMLLPFGASTLRILRRRVA